VSALLLVGLGFVAGLLLPRGRRRSALLEHRRSTIRALRRMRAMVAEVAEVSDHAVGSEPAVEQVVAAALTDVLHLRGCRFEPTGGREPPLPELGADGELAARVVHRVPRGVLLPEAAALPARHGRFVLAGGPIGCTLEERIVASAMVDLAGQAAASEDDPARSVRRR
jgi:hypothetical protein